MEMADALLYIAGALMMGLGALGAAVGIGVLAAAFWKVLHVSRN